FLAIAFLWRSYQKQKGDVALVRKRKANRVARKNLKQAGEYLRKELHTAFFEEISRALWGYISNKFNIPLAELSIESVSQRLSVKGVKEEMILNFTAVLENCEYARFAPGDKAEKMQEIYRDALAVITKMEQELK
ncbi:MAG: protein BatD, partial [Bacteroidales bacterium]|nr:protein BatD [Bacteroidales bacterium]